MGKSLIPQQSSEVVFTELEDKLLWTLAEGATPGQIARTIYPKNTRKQLALRIRLYRMFSDIRLQNELAARLKLISILGLGAAIKALNRKAAAGRVDGIKLVFESSGFYNPRVQHEHGGDIKITIRNAPRPERTDEEYIGDAVEIKDEAA
jgi:hypothetical protein